MRASCLCMIAALSLCPMAHAQSVAPNKQAVSNDDPLQIIDNQVYIPPANPAAKPIPVPAATTKPIEVWTTQSTSLRASMEAWAKKAGWELQWRASSDRTLDRPLRFTGSFTDAVRGSLDLYRNKDSVLSAGGPAAFGDGMAIPQDAGQHKNTTLYADGWAAQRLMIVTEEAK